MFQSKRMFVAAMLATGLAAVAVAPLSHAYDSSQVKCRQAISKSGAKYAKTAQKVVTNCHKSRDKSGPNSTDCNDIATADVKAKVQKAAIKFETQVLKKCATGTPGDVGYDECPLPCSSISIATFGDLVNCQTCLTRANVESMADLAYGLPQAPISDELEADCHKAVLKNAGKLYDSVLKGVGKCQYGEEKAGSEGVEDCTQTNFASLTGDAYNKAFTAILGECDAVELPSATLDACDNAASGFDLALCAADTSRGAAQDAVVNQLDLSVAGPTTTTTTTTSTTDTTTTTTNTVTSTTVPPGASHPQCPNLGELVLYSRNSNEACTSNGDCTLPRTCDTSLGRCTTMADLDSGWNGAGHNGDINDGVTARARLACPGPPSPGCGQCAVLGLEPSPGNCRCANNVQTKCDEPFAPDADDCGGATCNCFFGSPFPLAAQGTPVCVSNRFSEDITGTANPDLGSGVITAKLRTQVFLGITTDLPCPVCGGKCSNDASGCILDSDCDGGATCVQDTPGDGVRDGVCVRNPDTHVGDGTPCDIDGTNANFPAVIGNPVPGSGGAGYSIDCQPDVGKNVSGQGLRIDLTQTTGVASLSAGLDCDAGGVGTDLCPCMVCSGDQTFPCDSDSDCAALGGSCSGAPNGGGVACNSNAACTAADIGPCNNLGRCTRKTSKLCGTNADCQNQNVGPCNLQTCTADGMGSAPQPNFCTDDICTDQGGGQGTCASGPSFKFCDGLVKADGAGINSCSLNADCAGGYGNCTIETPADCFLDPIVATGVADPQFPVAGAVFCIPPTSNSGVNDSAGLPGPGRVLSQGAARTFCTSNNAVEYNPGGVPACP